MSPSEVQELLGVLHSHGYRLRKFSSEGIEVVEAGPTLTLSPTEVKEAERQAKLADAAEAEEDLFAHVGGKPDWLRRQKRRDDANPWADNEGPNA